MEHSELTVTINGSSQASIAGQRRRRARQPVPRTLRVEFTLTDEEYAVLEAAARRAGLARGAYAAQAALAAAANGRHMPGTAATGADRADAHGRAGPPHRCQLDQAVAKLNATGQPAGDLPGFAAGSLRRAEHLDAVADAVRRALP